MIKLRHLIANTLNIMDKCPICNKKMTKLYVEAIPGSNIENFEKSCYKCTCIIMLTFEFTELKETSIIIDDMKLLIEHKENKSGIYQRKYKFLTANNSYVQIYWKTIMERDGEFEYDLFKLKDLKQKIETLVSFS